ncbi:MAG: isoprenylcysteine carboxylmethyltransferase family protein [Saprospiraceae bacterium]
MKLLIFSLCLTGYYLLHSILADNRVKEKLYTLLPVRYYRLFFNVLSIVLLVVLLTSFKQLSSPVLFDALPLVGAILMGLGGLLLLLSLRNYDLGEFSGIHQLNHDGAAPNHALNQKGLNGIVRHPLYTATFLLLWGFFLYYPALKTLCLSGISSLYLIIGTRLEERKLVTVFGEAYLAYQKQVGRFLPRI